MKAGRLEETGCHVASIRNWTDMDEMVSCQDRTLEYLGRQGPGLPLPMQNESIRLILYVCESSFWTLVAAENGTRLPEFVLSMAMRAGKNNGFQEQ